MQKIERPFKLLRIFFGPRRKLSAFQKRQKCGSLMFESKRQRSRLSCPLQHLRVCLKITVITAVFNRPETIGQAIDSVANQTFTDVEHLIIDGASTDATMTEIERHRHSSMIVHSEPDAGIYDALNKGVQKASGDIVGVMGTDLIAESFRYRYSGTLVLDNVSLRRTDP